MTTRTLNEQPDRNHSELILLPTFRERFNYLKLGGSVGADTFGFDRYLNQRFYRSREWLSVRDYVIVRDLGCDLGIEGYEILHRIIIHHMNPISVRDIQHSTKQLLDPEYLICTTHATHNAIHYGDESLLQIEEITRAANDTSPWRIGR